MKSEIPSTINGSLPDGGPLYAETDLTHFIAEPWNAVSSLSFIVVVIFWTIKLRGNFNQYRFLSFCLPLLFLGGLGSTLFHAFRSSSFLLLLDVLPIAVLTLLVSIYFWMAVLKNKWKAGFVIIPFILTRLLSFHYLPTHTAINSSYFVTGVVIFLPTVILLIQTQAQGFWKVSLACLFLTLSLLCREIDAWTAYMPMGTHWLWHVLSAVGSWFLAEYLYLLKKNNIINFI